MYLRGFLFVLDIYYLVIISRLNVTCTHLKSYWIFLVIPCLSIISRSMYLSVCIYVSLDFYIFWIFLVIHTWKCLLIISRPNGACTNTWKCFNRYLFDFLKKIWGFVWSLFVLKILGLVGSDDFLFFFSLHVDLCSNVSIDLNMCGSLMSIGFSLWSLFYW